MNGLTRRSFLARFVGDLNPHAPLVGLQHGVGHGLGAESVIKAGHGSRPSTMAETNSHIKS